MIVNEVDYGDTAPEVIDILEACRHSRTRIRVAYGDRDTGQDWGETFETTGYVSTSTGPRKVPLLIYSRRSYGGGVLSASRVLRIETTKGRRLLYQAHNYKPPREGVTCTD